MMVMQKGLVVVPAFSIGRIPYETLEESVLRDDSGQVLWYVLADNFRNIGARFTPLNSDTPAGVLTLDGQNDIVALIIAPGYGIANQQSDVANPGDAVNLNPANFLENDNADGDASFISSLLNDVPPTFNDRVIALTRQELMAAVEKRVMGDVATALDTYRTSFGAGNEAYPWLAQFTDPSLSNYLGNVGTSSGHLPFHFVGQVYNNQSDGTINWSAVDGNYTVISGDPPDEDCLRNTNCSDDPDLGDFLGPFTFDANSLNCTWSDALNFNCTGTITQTRNLCWPSQAGCFIPYQTLTRTMILTLDHSDDGTGVTTSPDTLIQPRTRNLDTAGFDNTSNFTLNVVDTIGAPFAFCELIHLFLDATHLCPTAGVRGEATLSLAAGDTIDMQLTGIDFHLDANGLDLNADNLYTAAGEIAPDIPPWFITNEWHHFTFISYPAAETLPGNFNDNAPNSGTGVCNGNCLTVTANNGVVNVSNAARALITIAGNDITGNRPSNLISDYFEGVVDANADGLDDDEAFDRQRISAAFNDQSRIVLTTTEP